jgi:hypothetical protein
VGLPEEKVYFLKLEAISLKLQAVGSLKRKFTS